MFAIEQRLYNLEQQLSLLPVLFFAVIVGLSLPIQGAAAQEGSIQHQGRERTYRVHVPPVYEAHPDSSFSLILGLHGGLGSGSQFEQQSQLSAKADTARFPFVVVYPDGFPSLLGIRTWNAGNCCGYARDNEIDDVGFIEALIDRLLQDYRIDPDRIYATGISNGGMLSYRLATVSDRIAAAAPVAASLTHGSPLSHNEPVPLIHFHSFEDDNVPLEGGIENGLSNHHNPPADSALTAWARQNGCSGATGEQLDDPDNTFYKTWMTCGPRTEVKLWVSYDGGHSWPGGEKTVIGDPTSDVLDANGLMWDFFLENPRGTGSTAISTAPSNRVDGIPITVYPNPARHRVTFRWADAPSSFRAGKDVIIVSSILGREMARLPLHSAETSWDLGSPAGAWVASGLYMYRVERQGRSIGTGAFVVRR